MDITGELKEYLQNLGADLVGVAPASALSSAGEGFRPADYLIAARSIVSIAYALNRGPVKNLPASRNEYVLEFDCVNGFLKELGYRGARFLERKGYDSLPFSPEASIGDAARLMGDLSHKHAAVACGMGLFGLNNLVLNPRFGPRLRFCTIVTSAPLIPDEPLQNNPCTLCEDCVAACPAQALNGWRGAYSPEEGWRMDKEKCYHYIFVRLAGKRCGMCIGSCPQSQG